MIYEIQLVLANFSTYDYLWNKLIALVKTVKIIIGFLAKVPSRVTKCTELGSKYAHTSQTIYFVQFSNRLFTFKKHQAICRLQHTYCV